MSERRSTGSGAGIREGGPLALPRGAAEAFAVAGLLTMLVAHFSWSEEPFDISDHGTVSGFYGYSARAFDAHGYFDLRMQPCVFFQPETKDTFIPYLNHPVFPHALTFASYKLLGRDEQALRFPPSMLMVLTGLALWGIGRSSGRRRTGALAVAFFATSGTVLQHGNLVDAFPFNLACLSLTLWAHIAHQRQPTRARFVAYLLAAFAAALCDWTAYFLVPVLWLDLFFGGKRPKRPWRAMWWIGFPFGVGLVLTLASMIWALGGVQPLVEQLGVLATVPSGADAELLDSEWDIDYFANMRGYLDNCYGIPVLLLAALGFLGALGRLLIGRGQALDRAIVLALLGGGLPLGVFWSRAGTIEFWLLLSLPAISLSAAVATASIARILVQRLPRGLVAWSMVALLFALFINSTLRGYDLHDRYRSFANREHSECVNEFAYEGDVVLTTRDPGAHRFYVDATCIPGIVSLDVLQEVLAHIKPARHLISRIYWTVPASDLRFHTWATQLPRKAEPHRRLPYGKTSLYIVELDKERCFAD